MALHYYCSTVSDGTMKSIDGNHATARIARIAFLKKQGINPQSTTLHTLSYGGDNYCRYRTLGPETKGDGIVRDGTIDADAVVTTDPNHALLLPLGTVSVR